MADFTGDDLTRSRFERVNLSGSAPRSFQVRECLLVVLNEEWEHRRYAERDLTVLESRQRKDADG